MALRRILLWMTSSNRQSFIATNSGLISIVFGESHRNCLVWFSNRDARAHYAQMH